MTNSATNNAAHARSALEYKGTWTQEEEAYVDGLIVEFRAGNLPIKGGELVTLRSFLAKELGCDKKRITKKFENSGYNGRLVFTPADSASILPNEARLRQDRLQALKKRFVASRQALADAQKWKAACRKGGRKKKTDISNANGAPVNQAAQTQTPVADIKLAVFATIAAIDEQLESIAALRAFLLARNNGQQEPLSGAPMAQSGGNHQGPIIYPYQAGTSTPVQMPGFFVPVSPGSVNDNQDTVTASTARLRQNNSVSNGNASQAFINRGIQELLQQPNVVAPTPAAPRAHFLPFPRL